MDLVKNLATFLRTNPMAYLFFYACELKLWTVQKLQVELIVSYKNVSLYRHNRNQFTSRDINSYQFAAELRIVF